MAAFGTGASRQLSARGGAPGFKFTLYGALSIVMMFLDQRGGYLDRIRYALQAAAYPVQLAVSSPSTAWKWVQENIETRDALRAENTRLLLRQRELELRSMRYEALARENDQLRGLREALPPVAERWLPAEVVDLQLSTLRQRVLIDRGTTNGVFKGQALLDDKGLLGQTTHVGPWSSEVILLTDPEHAVPVQIERTGLRTIAVGTGDTGSLALPYLPGNADVKSGDLLMSSGLGGVFPAGYPVGRVTEVHRDAVQPLAQVRAVPFARIEADREVMLVWFRQGHPAAPVATTTGDAKTGNPSMQPLVAQHSHPIAEQAAASPPAARSPAAANTAGSPGASAGPPGTARADDKASKRRGAPVPAPAESADEESPPYESEAPAVPPPPQKAQKPSPRQP